MSDPVREQVVSLLKGGNAHVPLDKVVKDFPAKLQGVKPNGAPHTAWQLLEHLRIAQWDILEFSRSSSHVSPEWPGGYWPKTEKPPAPPHADNSKRADAGKPTPQPTPAVAGGSG